MSKVTKKLVEERLKELTILHRLKGSVFKINTKCQLVMSFGGSDKTVGRAPVLFDLLDSVDYYLKEPIVFDVPVLVTPRHIDIENSVRCLDREEYPLNKKHLPLYIMPFDPIPEISTYRRIPSRGISFMGLTVCTLDGGKEVYHTVDTKDGFVTMGYYKKFSEDYVTKHPLSDESMVSYRSAIDWIHDTVYQLTTFVESVAVKRTKAEKDELEHKWRQSLDDALTKLTENSIFGKGWH